MAYKVLLDDIKKIHFDYMKLSIQQTPFLSTRLKARIKLRLKNDLKDKISDKNKLEKLIQKNINTTRLVSWSRINSLANDTENEQMDGFRSWLFSISLDILLLKLVAWHKESGMNELFRMYNLPVRSFIAKNLYGKKGTEYFNIKCNDLTMETFQRFLRYSNNFSPYKGTIFSYLISIADHLIKDETTQPETLVSDFNEQDETETGGVFWAVSPDPSPELVQEKITFEKFIIEQIVLEGGYPWQILVVLLTKTTNDRTDITQLGDFSIAKIYQEMKNTFTKSSFHEEHELDELFQPLEKQLSLTLNQIIPSKDHRSRSQLETCLDQKLGLVPLKTFFGKDPLKNIRDWNHRLFKRVRKKVIES